MYLTLCCCIQGQASQVASLLSAQLLLAMDSFEAATVPRHALIELFPSSFPQVLGRYLQEQQTRLIHGCDAAHIHNFSKWPLLWHLHMQQHGGPNYSNYDARWVHQALSQAARHVALLMYVVVLSTYVHKLLYTARQRQTCGGINMG